MVMVNDQPANFPLIKASGYKFMGNFGSTLHSVFVPKSQAKFTAAGPREIAFSIAKEHSGFGSTYVSSGEIASACYPCGRSVPTPSRMAG